MRYAVFVTTIMLDDESDEPEFGLPVVGLTNEEVVEVAQDSFAELNANDGPSDPWLVDQSTLSAIEALLPKEKY